MEQSWSFLLSSSLFHLVNKRYLVSDKTWVFWEKMMKSSTEGEWLQNKKWSGMELSSNGFILLNVNGKILICSADLTFKCLSISP